MNPPQIIKYIRGIRFAGQEAWKSTTIRTHEEFLFEVRKLQSGGERDQKITRAMLQAVKQRRQGGRDQILRQDGRAIQQIEQQRIQTTQSVITDSEFNSSDGLSDAGMAAIEVYWITVNTHHQMSHVQNLQRLRLNNNSVNKQRQKSPYSKSPYRLNLDHLATIRLNLKPGSEAYHRFLDSKPVNSRRQYLRKSDIAPSIQVSTNDKRQDGEDPSPFTRNLSIKLPRKSSVSNPLTERRNHEYGIDDFDEAKLASDVIGKSSFKQFYVIGKGGFGKVWRVQMKKNGKIYAMKQMYKSKIISKKSINSVMNQRQLLSRLSHPFLVNMSYAFQDKENLYLIMDYLNGGDLRYHIVACRRFTENEAKFFICCLLLCVQYLHSNNIIHRDIKPQNLVLDSNGYLRLTDLGVSRRWRQDNASDTSGTPGYMAPEIMCHKNHSFAADYFAIGVLGYQMMIGRRPYLGKDRREIRDSILSKQAAINLEDVPYGWSRDSADFINKLLIRNPQNRLGYNSGEEVRRHPWLKSVEWARLFRKEMKAPFVPINIQANYDDYKRQISQDTIVDNSEQNALLLRDASVQQLFKGYQHYLNFKPTKAAGTARSTLQTNNNEDELLARTARGNSPSKR